MAVPSQVNFSGALLQRIYPGGTAIPAVYDPNWRGYTNLTADQRAAFMAFPQDLIAYTSQLRWQYEIRSFDPTMQPPPNPYITIGGIPVYPTADNRSLITGLAVDAGLNPNSTYNFTVNGTVVNLTAAQAVALFSGLRSYIQQCRDIEASMISGINAQTVTLRSQINTAFAVLN